MVVSIVLSDEDDIDHPSNGGRNDQVPTEVENNHHRTQASDHHERQGSRAFDRMRNSARHARIPGRTSTSSVITNGLRAHILRRDHGGIAGRARGSTRPTPPITVAGATRKTQSTRRDHKVSNQDEEEAVARAIERSLVDRPARSSATSATTLYAPLKSVLEDMIETAQKLETPTQENLRVNLRPMSDLVRTWQGIVVEVVHALEAAEHQRVEDIRGQLSLDREMEQTHAKKVEQLNETWRDKIRQKAAAWKQEMDDTMQKYEAQLATQSHETEQPSSSTEVDCLQDYIVIFQAEHADTIQKIKANHEAEAEIMKAKFDRVCNENAALKATRKDAGEGHSPEKRTLEISEFTSSGAKRTTSKRVKGGSQS